MNKINEFIKQFTDKDIEGIIKLGKQYFLADKELEQYIKKVSREPYSIGIFLGEERKYFKPTPALLEMLANKSKRKARINEKSEWLFLCGRDVFGKNITQMTVEEGIVLVQNSTGENLGYAKIERKHDRVTLKNIMDRGYYLRREN